MKHCASQAAVVFLILGLMLFWAPVLAADAADPVGDWLMKIDFNGREMESILSISKDKAGLLVGQTLGFWGMNPLIDLKIEGDALSYKQVFRFGGNESTSTFKGTIKDGKLAGTTSSERGDYDLTGEKIKPLPPVVGNWEFIRKRNDREIKSVLTVKADKDGKLSAVWTSRRGESNLTNVNYADGKLTFKRVGTNPDRPFEVTYEMTVDDDEMSGTMTSSRGERQVEGELIGDDLIGKWELNWTTDRGPRKQQLIVYPDLSGRLGSEFIEKIELDGDNVHFKLVRTFGDRTFETELSVTLDDDDLTGEISTFGGTQKVEGKKIDDDDDDDDDDD